VRVVPGPVTTAACRGSNQLLYDGPGPVRDAQDVLDVLGIYLPGEGVGPRAESGLSAQLRSVLGCLADTGSVLDEIVSSTAMTPPAVSAALEHLRNRGLVMPVGGRWCPVAPTG